MAEYRTRKQSRRDKSYTRTLRARTALRKENDPVTKANPARQRLLRQAGEQLRIAAEEQERNKILLIS